MRLVKLYYASGVLVAIAAIIGLAIQFFETKQQKNGETENSNIAKIVGNNNVDTSGKRQILL
jgi:hypothetical protein